MTAHDTYYLLALDEHGIGVITSNDGDSGTRTGNRIRITIFAD